MASDKTTPIQRRLDQLRREGEERSAERLAKDLNYPYLDLTKTAVSLEALRVLTEERAKEAQAATVTIDGTKVALAVADPKLQATIEILKELEEKHFKVKVFVASLSGIKQAWHLYEFVPDQAKDITGKVDIQKAKFEEFSKKWKNLEEFKKELENLDIAHTTTTDILEMILAEALAVDASDIHFESQEGEIRVRFRIDGLLHDALPNFPIGSYDKLVSRIKLLSGLKMNVHGEPQDGRFTIELTSKEIEMRVSIIPSQFGETIVMRVLNPDAIRVSLAALGLREDDLKLVEKQLVKPNGLILNTGPTGSGKTTTLYAFLQHLSNPETKIITIEDPIEYRLGGIEQTQVDVKANYTFAKGLRAIVRQDPDVILVGEVRDLETAEIAMQAALTGHTVLSTLHTNDAVGSVPRLVDLGVKTATIGPALNLIIAQRLVRKLCEKCRKQKTPSEDELKKIKEAVSKISARVDKKPYENFVMYEAVGCVACNGFGYKGRIGIFEFLETGPEFEEVILKEASEVALKRFAVAQGMVTMQQDGILKVLKGITTLEEVEKVTGAVEFSS